jgi:phosphoribosylanthranilate isomerase
MVIRRVIPTLPFDWRPVDALGQRCMPLLDPGSGSGRPWDWAALDPPPAATRFGLAGGLTPDTVATAVRTLRPWLVDVSSGVERSPGVKDPKKVLRFVESARTATEFDPDE